MTRYMRLCASAALVGALAISACGGHTTAATDITPTTAQVNAVGHCDTGEEGRVFFDYRQQGTSAWTRRYAAGDGRILPGSGSKVNTDPCGSRIPATGEAALLDTIEGLMPGTTYQYRVGFRFASNGSSPTHDSNEDGDEGELDQFTTTACDDTQGATQTAQQFVDEAGNQNGTSTNPDVLCLRDGSQNLVGSQELEPNANQYIVGQGASSVLNGNIEVTPSNPNVTFENFKIVGCNTTCASGVFDVNKVIHADANGVHLRFLDISQKGGLNSGEFQNCIIVGDSSPNKVTGFELTDSRSHDCGDDDDPIGNNHDHGIYCGWASGPKIVGNWFYRNEGFGIQLYPDCDSALVEGNMVANNGFAITYAGEGSSHSDAGQFKYNAVGYTYETGSTRVPISCYMPGTTATAIDNVLYDPNAAGTTNCGSALTQTNTLNASPGFENLFTSDLNVTGSGGKERVGLKYAENVPGPR